MESISGLGDLAACVKHGPLPPIGFPLKRMGWMFKQMLPDGLHCELCRPQTTGWHMPFEQGARAPDNPALVMRLWSAVTSGSAWRSCFRASAREHCHCSHCGPRKLTVQIVHVKTVAERSALRKSGPSTIARSVLAQTAQTRTDSLFPRGAPPSS